MSAEKNILCYGDSNTWGAIPDGEEGGGGRLPRHQRWPGLVQNTLGENYHIIEEGLCGRTTVFDDPSMPGRNGLKLLEPLLHTHQPLVLLVFMLGTNDTKVAHSAPVIEITLGMEALVKTARNPFVYDGGRVPEVLILSPVLVEEGDGWGMFSEDSAQKSQKLAGAYRGIAEGYGCHFLDAAQYAKPSPTDGLHLNAAGHAALAAPVAAKIKEILG